MKYFEFTFHTNPSTEIVNDVLAAVLGETGFESFVENENGLTAYIQQTLCDETSIKNAIAGFPLSDTEITYTYAEAEDKDWNEEWEKNFFQPIIIGNRCVIHSTFHQDIPKAEYDIVINPQMAFGTGHHETTSLIIEELLDSELKDKSLLDMGCGTSILAILARMKGAHPCTAIDIDEWCVRNSIENIELNHVDNIAVSQGDASSLSGKGPFDVVIANINRNILLNDMRQYVTCMHPGAELYMSGFYVDDIPVIREEAEKNGLTFVHYKEKNRFLGQSDAVEKINEARAFMKRNIDNPMSVESIAQSLNVSYSWFRSTFKSYTGVSPAQYQLHLRYLRAKELLSTSRLSISEIAYALNFETVSQFSTFFTKKEGLSPSKFRSILICWRKCSRW